MVAQIKLKDGRIVSAGEHYHMLCEQYGLSGTKHIRRDPANPNRWIEYDAKYTVLEPTDASEAE